MATIRNGRVTLSDDLDSPASGSGRVFSGYHLASSSMGRRRNSYRALGSPRSPRFFHESRFEDDARYFLDSCALCKKPLGGSRDIFMYRGDTAFCSEECRQEQIEMDEAKEKNWSNLSMKASSRKEQKGNIPVRATGAIVAG